MSFSPDVLALNPELATVATATKKRKATKETAATRPLTAVSMNKLFTMHKYHCPACGCAPKVGGTNWTEAHGLTGFIRFQCGHTVKGAV